MKTDEVTTVFKPANNININMLSCNIHQSIKVKTSQKFIDLT